MKMTKISELISNLQEIMKEHGDLEVYIEPNREEIEDITPYAGYISLNGEIYSDYMFTEFSDEFPEREEFDLEKDKLCII